MASSDPHAAITQIRSVLEEVAGPHTPGANVALHNLDALLAENEKLRRALRAEIKRRYGDVKLYPSEAQLDKAEAEALRRAES